MRLGVLALAWCLACPAAALDLTIVADPRKWNGQPWDGIEVWGPVGLPTSGPPDLGVCVVRASGELDCLEAVATGPGGRRSICPNSFDCRFTVRRVGQGEPFGLFLYDIDTLPGDYDDLVDLVILTPEGGAAASTIRAIDGRLREQMDRQAHARLPAERARRSRETAVLSTEACRTGCRLGQSVLTIAP